MGEEETVGGDGKENQHGDEAVGGEEGGIQFAEVIGFDQGVLVKQSDAGDGHPGNGEAAKAEAEEHPGKEGEGDEVEDAGQAEGSGDSEGARDGVEAAGNVVAVVLTAIENVETSAPEHYRSGHDQDAGIEGSANRDPGGSGSDAHGEAEKQVRPASESLGVGVGADDDEGQRRKIKSERIQHPGGEEEQRRSRDSEAEDEAAGEQSGRQCADGGARIQRVDIGINEAVEGHGGRAGGDHGNTDPCEGAEGWNAVGGDDGAGEPEGESEKGMLPLDHVESYANVMEHF